MLLRAMTRNRSLVLCYHGLGPSVPAIDPHLLRVPPDRFRRQVESLRDAGFRFVTVAEMADRMNGDSPPEPGLVALTFDDGMEDNHSVLLPILQEYGIPATVYVTTGVIGAPNPWLEGERMMTEPELRDLAQAGVEIGAHTVTHPDLAMLDREACVKEMAASREQLERITGMPVRTFAYPFCTYGPAAVEAAAECGFTAAVTCQRRGGWKRLELRRALITGKDRGPSFLLKLTGLYEPLFHSPPVHLLRVTTRGLRARARGAAVTP